LALYDIEHANALAKKSLTTYSDVADTSIKTAGFKGDFFITSTGLQKMSWWHSSLFLILQAGASHNTAPHDTGQSA